jgi:hypothetical protein
MTLWQRRRGIAGVATLVMAAVALWRCSSFGYQVFNSDLNNRNKPPLNLAPVAPHPVFDNSVTAESANTDRASGQ